MAFSPIDLAIQEILQSDFIVDIAQIHNSNVLILKDKIEDLINTLEIDINTISIGVDNPINNIKTQNIVIQDGGWIYQTGIPNQVIASLTKDSNGFSVLKVDYLNIDFEINSDIIESNSLVINNSLISNSESVFNGKITYDSSLVESKETVTANLEFNGIDTAVARIRLTDTSKRNIYVTLSAETNLGATQVWNGSSFTAGLNNIKIYLDLDANSPLTPNTSFTVYLADVIENSAGSGITSFINLANFPVTLRAGENLSAGSVQILLHNDFELSGLKLGINPASTNILSSSITSYSSNATFNYIVDASTNDRFIITSVSGMEVFI
jgi:hypothetical protein